MRVSDGGRGICVGEGTGVGGRATRHGPWVVVVYIFRGVEWSVREEECSSLYLYLSSTLRGSAVELFKEVWSVKVVMVNP